MTPLPLMPGVSPAGDRGAAYATTPMHDENQLVQAVFAQLMGQYDLTIRSGVLGAEPRTLYDLLAVLAVADEQVAKPIARHCHELLSQGGYYGFLSETRKADTLSRAHMAPEFLVATWLDGLQRHGANYAAFSEIADRRPWPLWEAMRDMYGSNVAFFEQLVAKARTNQSAAHRDR